MQHILNKAILLYQSEMKSNAMINEINSNSNGNGNGNSKYKHGLLNQDDQEEHVELNSYHGSGASGSGSGEYNTNELSFSNLTGMLPDSSDRIRFERML